MELSDPKKFKVIKKKNGDEIITLIRKNKIDQIKDIIKETEFFINFDYSNDYTLVSYKHGGFLIEFCVSYDKNFSNCIESDGLSLEEFDVKFEVKGVDELHIYNPRNEEIEHTDEENEEMIDLLRDKLVGFVSVG